MTKQKCTADDNSIISSVLSDVNAIVPRFLSLSEAYRLIVGAAEELSRMPNVPFEILERAIIRSDRAGELIDILLELLCCKIKFSSRFLSVTCAPVDIIEQFSECDPGNRKTAEQIFLIETMRRFLENFEPTSSSCFNPPPIIKPSQPAKQASQQEAFQDQTDEEFAEYAEVLTTKFLRKKDERLGRRLGTNN